MIKQEKEFMYREIGKDALFKTWHCSDTLTLLYVHKGSGTIVCSEKAYPLKEGVLCLIGRGKFHYTMPDNPEIYERSKLFLAEERFKKILSFISDNGLNNENREFIYAQINEEDRKNIENIFDELSGAPCDKEEYKNAFISSAAMRLIAYLDKFMLEDSQSASGFMAKAIEYINDNISHEITIDDICKTLHMSKYYFCRVFKEESGCSPLVFRRKYNRQS